MRPFLEKFAKIPYLLIAFGAIFVALYFLVPSTEATVTITALVGAVLFAIYMKFGRRKAEFMDELYRSLTSFGIPKADANFRYYYTTPGGVRVMSVVEVPDSVLPVIDEGIMNQLTRHSEAYPNWSAYKTLANYDVAFVEPTMNHGTGVRCVTEVNDPGSYCVFVSGIKTAGTVSGCDDLWEEISIRPVIIAAHQAGNNWTKLDFVMHTMWHESEHVREWMNRRNDPTGLFYNYLGPNDVHPHVPGASIAVGFASRPSELSCGFREMRRK